MATNTTTDPNLIPSAVSSILGFQSTAAEDVAAAQGQGFVAAGTTAEAAAYGSAADIATQNAQLEQVAGQVQEFQAQQELTQGLGTEQAGVAGGGFAASGSALDILSSSYRKGLLNQQIINTNTNINVAGYLAQATTSKAEQDAATQAAAAATALQTSYTQAATTATTNQANETAALMGYITATQPAGGATLTPEAAFSESLLAGQPGSPVSMPTGTWVNQNGSWVYSTGSGAGTIPTGVVPGGGTTVAGSSAGLPKSSWGMAVL